MQVVITVDRAKNIMNVSFFNADNKSGKADKQMQIAVTTYVNPKDPVNAVVKHQKDLKNKNNDMDRGCNPMRFPLGPNQLTGIIDNPKKTKEVTTEEISMGNGKKVTSTKTSMVKDGRFGDVFITTSANFGDDCIHYTDLDYTWGCIGVKSREDMDVLVEWYSESLEQDQNRPSTITVSESEPAPLQPVTSKSSDCYNKVD